MEQDYDINIDELIEMLNSKDIGTFNLAVDIVKNLNLRKQVVPLLIKSKIWVKNIYTTNTISRIDFMDGFIAALYIP